ncbi:MAG TPA: ester cyclase [Ktedonobacteraceae bacterium]|nr:ester cyclase [Ktedonobacteraceae bacterium]
MSTEQNRAHDRRFVEEVWSQGNMSAVDEVLANNYILHDPSRTIHGPEGFKQFVSMFRSAFPDLHMTIEDQIAEGDKLVRRFKVHGTHQGELQDIPPTGKQVTVSGILISRYENGKLAEDWSNFDALGMLQQLGVIPAMG